MLRPTSLVIESARVVRGVGRDRDGWVAAFVADRGACG
jgi:hypothetical protein